MGLSLGLPGLALLTGCNMITGADGITFDDDDDDDDGGGVGPSGVGGGGVGAGGPGATGPGATGAGGFGQGGDDPIPEDLAPADGVGIDRISIYQGVERELMAGGAEVSTNIPVVAERDATVRVFYTATGSVDALARLTIGGQTFEASSVLSGTSQNGDLGSTINFDVPASAMALGAQYRVDILQPAAATSGNNTDATYPAAAGDLVSLEVEKGGPLDIVLVPVEMGGRLPDTSPAQLALYEAGFRAMYPVEAFNLSVRAAVGSNATVSPNGSGWGAVLDGIADLRVNDGVPASTYYYGVFSPASSFSAYCSGGCVSGLGFVGGPSDTYTRASIGLGFTGQGSVDTMLHEIGHNHGRPHAPCGGASGPDPQYPYGGGSIGSWGFDVYSQTLYAPNQYTDMMGYCNPTWISDFNFLRLFQRVQAVTGNNHWQVPAAQLNQTYQRARVHPDGALTPLGDVQLELPPQGEVAAVDVLTTAGVASVTGAFYPYDHLEGGVLLVPPTPNPMVTTATPGRLSATIRGQQYGTP
ncbi:MAG: M66 family metalloprotease [Myxococcota bacterium]